MKRKRSGPGWRPEPRGAGSGRLSDSQYEAPSSALTSVLLQTIRLQVINTNNNQPENQQLWVSRFMSGAFFFFSSKDKVDAFHRVTRSHTTCQVSETVGIIRPRPFEVGQSVRPPLHHRPSSSHVVHLTEDLAGQLIMLNRSD